jgi:hypothetical protein
LRRLGIQDRKVFARSLHALVGPLENRPAGHAPVDGDNYYLATVTSVIAIELGPRGVASGKVLERRTLSS